MNYIPENHYVYCHFRNDTGVVFYIGKGQKNRAYTKQSRNPYWHNVVKKASGFRVEIIAKNLTAKEALQYERVLIQNFKKQHLDSLCNLTDGGEGGLNPSVETREKQRQAKLGKKLSEEVKAKIAVAGKNRVFTKETKEKLRLVQLGRTSPYKGIARSPEVCLKISESKKAKNFKHTEEAKAKMSLAKKTKRKV